jgi:competence protein ComEA
MDTSRSTEGAGALAAKRDEGEEGWIARARRALADSAWSSLAGKGLLYVVGFALLALVGSGKLRWPSPEARGPLAVGIAEAAAAPLPSGVSSAAASASPSASASASPSALPSASPSAEAPAADGGAPAASGVSADGKVILNLATEEDLRRLPSIGATRAKAILALRARLGRFSRVEDLLKVKGIGRRSLARLRPLVQIDPSAGVVSP